MMLRKFLPAAAALAGLLLSGCARENADLLEAVKERGELRIALEGLYPPWNYHDEKGDLAGFDVEVAKAIAEHIGVKAVFMESMWDGIFTGLDSGRYDIVANEVEVTDARKEKYDFSDPYAYVHTVVITRKDYGGIKSVSDLKGKVTANSITSTYAAIATENGATSLGVETLDGTIEMLSAGRIDATLNSDISFLDYLSHHPGANAKIALVLPNPGSVAIPIRKGDGSRAFREAVNEAISNLRVSGRLREISVKYLGRDLTERAAP